MASEAKLALGLGEQLRVLGGVWSVAGGAATALNGLVHMGLGEVCLPVGVTFETKFRLRLLQHEGSNDPVSPVTALTILGVLERRVNRLPLGLLEHRLVAFDTLLRLDPLWLLLGSGVQAGAQNQQNGQEAKDGVSPR